MFPVYTVVIVGCGNIAGRFDEVRPPGAFPLTHAGAFTQQGGFRLLACVEPDARRRAVFQQHWRVPHGFDHMDGLRSLSERIDVLSICSPTDRHAADLEAAVALKPRLIFCEKPVTAEAAETARWIERAERAGIVFVVNHTRRWAPDLQELALALKHGTHGELRSVVAVYTRGVLNNGSHLVDLIHQVVGSTTLHAVGRPVVDQWPHDPSVPFTLYAGDVPVQVSVGDARDYAMFEVSFVTSQAVLSFEDGGRRLRVRRAGASGEFAGYKVLGDAVDTRGRYEEAPVRAAVDIHHLLTHGGTPLCTGHDALAAQRLCEQIRDVALDRLPPPNAPVPQQDERCRAVAVPSRSGSP